MSDEAAFELVLAGLDLEGRRLERERVQDEITLAPQVGRIDAVGQLVGRLGEDFSSAVELVLGCEGMVVVTGMGKAGIVGAKISATLASTGTPSIALHPGEALHGDLGRLRATVGREGGISLFAIGDNLRKGAALNAVELAERLLN